MNLFNNSETYTEITISFKQSFYLRKVSVCLLSQPESPLQ